MAGSILAVDVGGSHVKALLSGNDEKRKFKSGPGLTAKEMADGVLEPVNLGEGWVGFDFEGAFGVPTKVVNDAVMQAIGSYEGGRMLFLGLGTGLGSALIADGGVLPMELGHLPSIARRGDNENAFVGGFRLWDPQWATHLG